jgi:hypothetical protein
VFFSLALGVGWDFLCPTHSRYRAGDVAGASGLVLSAIATAGSGLLAPSVPSAIATAGYMCDFNFYFFH